MKQRSIYWENGQESPRVIGFDDLPELVSGRGLTWLDLTDPSPDDMAQLGQTLRLDHHTIEDVLARRERPRIVRLGGYSFMTAYMTRHTHHQVGVCRISAYIFPTAFITIHPDDNIDIDEMVQRWRQDPHLVSWGVKGLLQGLMDVMVDAQFDTLEVLDAAADDLAKEVFTGRPDIKSLQQRTFVVRSELATLHRVIPQTRDIVATIIRTGLAEEWPAELRTYWEDINNHVLRASEWVDSLRDMLTSVFEASLALNDTRLNEVMKKLAAWAAIIAVPTLITGWYGMNVPYPGSESPHGLISVVVLIMVAVTSLFIVFKKNDWL